MYLQPLFQLSNSIRLSTSIMPRPFCPCATACESLKIFRQNLADRANRSLSKSVAHHRKIGCLTSVAGSSASFAACAGDVRYCADRDRKGVTLNLQRRKWLQVRNLRIRRDRGQAGITRGFPFSTTSVEQASASLSPTLTL